MPYEPNTLLCPEFDIKLDGRAGAVTIPAYAIVQVHSSEFTRKVDLATGEQKEYQEVTYRGHIVDAPVSDFRKILIEP